MATATEPAIAPRTGHRFAARLGLAGLGELVSLTLLLQARGSATQAAATVLLLTSLGWGLCAVYLWLHE